MKQFFKSAAFVAATLLIGFSAQSCTDIKPIDKTKLAGHWILQELEGEKVSEIHKGATPTIEFNFEEGRVNGSAGCNSYFGGFTLDEKNVFKPQAMAATRMACPDMKIEDRFLQAMDTTGLTIVLDEATEAITFKKADKAVFVFKKGEPAKAFEKKDITVANLEGDWKVTNMPNNDLVKLFGENVPTMKFTNEGKVFGFGGCNRFNATFDVADDAITLGKAASTMMAGPGLEGEGIFLKNFDSKLTAIMINDKLTLSRESGEIVIELEKYIAE